MKKISLLVVFIFTIVISNAQNVVGTWNGSLSVSGIKLRLVFHIAKSDSGYSSTMDSPDQRANGILVSSTLFADSVLKLAITNLRIEYQGKLSNDTIKGKFKQNGMSFPMNLSRGDVEEIKPRPQEPVKPYPYYSEDITFENTKDKITLAGTLTLPKKEGNFPVVVLITGSGPQNRDEELMGHKPFLVIADYLTRNGIAVLRFDDRGTAKSTGDFKTATTRDFVKDVESAVMYLLSRKEINKKKIGLIGHSEGGIVAPMVAAQNKNVSFIVLLAGTGIPGDQLLVLQQALIMKASGVTDENIEKSSITLKGALAIVKKESGKESLKKDLTDYIKPRLSELSASEKPAGLSDDDITKMQVDQLTSPWMQYFIKYDPSIILEKVRCSVLALNGEKDLQVPPKINLEAIKKSLAKGGNKKVTVKELPNLNHLFQECKTGAPSEYAQIEQTFSPVALTEISTWILNQVK